MLLAQNNFENSTYDNFKNKAMVGLTKIFSVAKDNVKFLNTLER